jgi:hypothetical protein
VEPVEYTIGEADHVAFNLLQWRAMIPRTILAGAVAVIALGVLAYAIDGLDAFVPVAIGGTIGVGAVLMIQRFIVVPRFARKTWREFKLLRETMTLSLGEEGFAIQQPSAHVDAFWQDMIAWDENARILAIYITRQLAYVLPKLDVGPDHIDYARERLIESGLIAKGTRRK